MKAQGAQRAKRKLKAQSTGVWFSVPRNFDPAAVGLADYANEARWMLHKIISLQTTYKHDGTGDAHGWVNISRETMETFIQPKDVKAVRTALLENEVIECNGKYRRKVHSMGYRLGEAYRGGTCRLECTKKSLAGKMRAHRIRRYDKPITEDQLQDTEKHLLRSLRMVRIDSAKAYEAIDRAEQDRPPEEARKVLSSYYKSINQHAVDQIKQGEIEMIICQYGRVHTPITRLLTEARSYLYFEDYREPLATIDISNSQPTFLLISMLSDFWDNQAVSRPNDRIPMDGSRTKDHAQRNDLQSPHTPRAIYQRAENSGDHGEEDQEQEQHQLVSENRNRAIEQLPEDVQEFVSRVLDGSIYGFLMDRHNDGADEEDRITSRGQFKQQFFANVLYGDTCKPWIAKTRLVSIFRQHFPTVWSYILRVKRWDGTGERQDAFKSLPRRMQRAESGFMFRGVVERLRTRHANIPILTVHDSIICPQSHAATVARIMLSEFVRIGLSPTLHIDDANGRREVRQQDVAPHDLN